MAVISSLGSLAQIEQPNWHMGLTHNSVSFYDTYSHDYSAIYRTQPNVRVCVDFLARNIAQLGLHVFRRVSETDRARVRDHGLPRLLAQPLPPEMKVTRYRLIEALMSDLGIYFNAYWWKVKRDGEIGGLLRLPPHYVTPQGGLTPTGYHLDIGGRHWELDPGDVVHFRGYNPENAIAGLAPLETLRRVLAEEAASGDYREEFWANSARVQGFIKRPKDAPEWSAVARERFLADFNQLYSGTGTGGGTAVLEEGMEWQQGSFNPQESEYILGRKLTREECARSYHIPLPMVGILDHATFSNISEQHKNLYQDSLGPWLVMIEQDIELQLLPEFDDIENVYVEFNIAEKLAGSFEDQVKAFQSAVGRPWMTPNEARARMNMPSLDGDADLLGTPLNMQVGETEAPAPAAVPAVIPAADDEAPKSIGVKRYSSAAPGLRKNFEAQWTRVLARHYRRQEAVLVSRVPKGRKATVGGVWYDEERWNKELTADLFGLNRATALAWSEWTAEQAGIDIEDEDAFESIMTNWLQEHSRVQAEGINGHVRDELGKALNDADPLEAVKNLFEVAVTAWAIEAAISAVTAAGNFGSHEAARAGGLAHKTWRTHSGNSRPSHAEMDGMTIGIRDLFPTGQRWPGDPDGGAEENSGCQCSVEFS